MELVFLLEAAEDRDRVLDRRLADHHRLEAPLKRRILLDMLAIFVERGRADAVKLAARQRRLEQVGRVHRALALAGADQGVHFVDEQDDVALALADLVEHALEALLELAAIFGAGDQRAHVERHQPPVLEAVGNVAIGDAQRQTLGDRGLADARLADQHRIVLGPAGEDLDGAADLLVAADDRIELAVARRLGEVAGEFLQGVVAVLGRLGVGGPAAAKLVDRGVERLRLDARVGERLAGAGGRRQHQRQKHPLDGDVAVAGFLGDLLGLVEHPQSLGVEARSRVGAAAGDDRDLRQRSSVSRRAASALPPARAIRPAAMPCSSSSRALSRWVGRDPLMVHPAAPRSAPTAGTPAPGR